MAGSERSRAAAGAPAPAAAVHFWDMDHTVLDCDAESTWKAFLIDKGLAPASDFALMAKFSRDYDEGVIDTKAYNEFLLREFAGRTEDEMTRLSEEHFEVAIRRAVFPGVRDILSRLAAGGAALCLITASNRIIAAPVAAYCGFPAIIATGLETGADGRFTGRIAGRYCFGPGKIPFMIEFCRGLGFDLGDAAYYGDSVNDVPILEAVGHPVAANPSPLLAAEAARRGWPVLDLREAR